MATFIWNANPGMWSVVPPSSDGWEALELYVTDPAAYVYWSTPRLQREIKLGDIAYIWRTTHKKGNNGVVACGCVDEVPRQLTSATASLFRYPDRLKAAGWDETGAPSPWKTGIRIAKTFWTAPINTGLRPPQGTVGRLSDADAKAIERQIG